MTPLPLHPHVKTCLSAVTALLEAFGKELRETAAAQVKAIARRLATEQARAVTTLHQHIFAATQLGGELRNPSAIARQVRKMAVDR